MKKSKTSFENTPIEILRYGKTCKPHQHVGPNGKNIRRIKDGHCLACEKELPDGAFEHVFEGVTKDIGKYASKEEAYEAHKKRVMKWQKENPDKFKGYVRKYELTDARKESHHRWYTEMPPEQKEELLANQRKRNKDTYWALTPEERRAVLDNQAAARRRRIAEKKNVE